MLRKFAILCVSAIAGVMVATSGTCGLGLLSGTFTWCGLPFYWIVGFPTAIVFALVFGIPIVLFLSRNGLWQWWQFAVGGVIVSMPFWYSLAEPFESARWAESGLFDSLNYLGSGAAAGFFYWWQTARLESKKLKANDNNTRTR